MLGSFIFCLFSTIFMFIKVYQSDMDGNFVSFMLNIFFAAMLAALTGNSLEAFINSL